MQQFFFFGLTATLDHHNYYILNLTLIALMVWKLFDPQVFFFGKIVVTMATLCLTNTKKHVMHIYTSVS